MLRFERETSSRICLKVVHREISRKAFSHLNPINHSNRNKLLNAESQEKKDYCRKVDIVIGSQ
jgi:hypothetical protein